MQNKRIAFDVSNLAHRQTGISRVHREIIIRLIKKKNLNCFFFSFSPILNVNKFGKKIKTYCSFKNKFLKFFWYNFYLPFLLKKNDIDYFFCHHRSPLLLSKKVKVLLVIHDLTWVKFKDTMTITNYLMDRFFMPTSVKRAYKIIVPTNSIKKEVINYFNLKKNKITKIYWGSIFKKAKNIKRINSKIIKFIFIGTFEPRKNLRKVILAFDALPRNLKKKTSFKIIGSLGWGNDNIKSIIAKNNLNNQIQILKNFSDQKLKDELSKSHYLILLSLYEGFGLPIIEAYSQNKPVITSNIGSMKELSRDMGILVDPYSIKKIKNALVTAIIDLNKYKKFQKKILNYKIPTWDQAANEILKLI